MTSMSSIRRATRTPPHEAQTHVFIIGQAVRLKDRFARPSTHDIYRITATLPPRGDSLQYRIRNNDERYERVTTQDSLEPVDILQSGSGATLIERTFGHS
jgi:hypothetical protein